MNLEKQIKNAETASLTGFRIPVKPEIINEIQRISTSAEPSLPDAARVIAKDIGLSGAILKTINSPFYGMSRMISDIEQAVILLGFDVVNTLVTCQSIKAAYVDKCCISLERFWDTATDVANAMLYLGKNLKDQIPQENLYTLGLFHDCGIPAFAIKFDDYKETLIKANSSNELTLTDLEDQLYNSNHAIVGYFIASAWKLPKDICNIILQHHSTDYLSNISGEAEQLMYAVLKAAENMVNRNRRLEEAVDWQFVKHDVFDVLGIHELDFLDISEEFGDLL